MLSGRRLFITLAVLIVVWYAVGGLLPPVIGTCLDGACNFTGREIAISLALPLIWLAIPIIAEIALYRKGLRPALDDLGLTRFSLRGFPLAFVYLMPLVVYYPAFLLIARQRVSLQPYWGWLVLGAILNNGLNEETMVRGFVFRHLREGRTFWRAAVLATVYFAAYHLLLIPSAGVLIGVVATFTAIPTGLLTALLYDLGDNTIWASFLVHVGTNVPAFIFALSPEMQLTAVGPYLLLSLIMAGLLIVWAYRRGYGREPDASNNAPPPDPAY